MGTGFHIRLEHDETSRTVVCGGELDIASAPTLAECLDLCEELKPRSVHVDGSDLTFVDSTGISVLIRSAHRYTEDGIAFSVTVSDQVREMLARAGTERLLLGRTPATTT